MRMKVKNPQDFWCALFFIALGVIAMYLAHNYRMGTALAMGPGYFPMWLGGILSAFGLVMGVRSFQVEAGEDGEDLGWSTWAFRPWLVLPAALVAFAVLMEADVGFVPSLFVLIIGCALAHKDVRWKETVLLSIFVTAAAVAIFSFGLDMPYRLFWWSD
ncbi:MAG: tripartite tricarboxylate transporter TctB family protein [Burkholderiales bacterium]|nr:tripartite tricarboxylate transporter TctB family protein [Burkholderiales bacterium]